MISQFRKTPRANWIDYDKGNFFITICTKNRVHYFGTITDGVMNLSEIGKIAEKHLSNFAKYVENIDIPLYIVMPNHVHLIVCIGTTNGDDEDINPISQRNPNPAHRANPICERSIPALSKYINSFKGAVCKEARKINSDFGWQSRYHDHLIRSINEASKISLYIENNVAKWDQDCYNPDAPQPHAKGMSLPSKL